MTIESPETCGSAVVCSGLFDILRADAYWTSGIFHSWQEGRGARAFRNSSIKTVDGKFRSKAEAMTAAENAIKARMLYGVRQWDSAKPVASFHIPHATSQKLGDIMDAALMSNSELSDSASEGARR